MAATTTTSTCFLFLFILSQVRAQPTAPSPAADVCNGVFLSYTFTSSRKIPPALRSGQPYRFQSTLLVLNNGLQELKSWRVFVGFQHDEFLVSASNAVLADGSSLPVGVGNGTVFAGYPNSDLKTAIETAGDQTQMGVQVDLVGTQFGVGSPDVPMPQNISLVNDGWLCSKPSTQGNIYIYIFFGLEHLWFNLSFFFFKKKNKIIIFFVRNKSN